MIIKYDFILFTIEFQLDTNAIGIIIVVNKLGRIINPDV